MQNRNHFIERGGPGIRKSTDIKRLILMKGSKKNG
jgi:hypothetical protein